MTNPFASRLVPLSGPARDLMPVTPDDAADLSTTAVSLYVETGGTLSLVTEARAVTVPDFMVLPLGVRRVNATGTSAAVPDLVLDGEGGRLHGGVALNGWTLDLSGLDLDAGFTVHARGSL